MTYIALIDHTVLGGLPCQIGVTSYRVVRGSFSYDAPSDLDYYGYTELEYLLLDRRGRHAPWLEARINAAEEADIRTAIHDYMKTLEDDHYEY